MKTTKQTRVMSCYATKDDLIKDLISDIEELEFDRKKREEIYADTSSRYAWALTMLERACDIISESAEGYTVWLDEYSKGYKE